MYFYESDILFGLLSALTAFVPSMIFGIATYVLWAVAIYTISRRRGLRKPWLAWVPVLNIWLLGSLSDQYRYVVKGENRSRRKILLTLGILIAALTAAILALAVVAVTGAVFVNPDHANVLGSLVGILGCLLPLTGAAIAYAVIRYMALYDVFKSLDPQNCVLFLVLSVLFSPVEPFFLFFNRSKDGGMPPRRQAPVHEAEPVREPWERENKDYL